MQINDKFIPLYTSTDDIIIVYGGRGSGKSFAISDYAGRITYSIGEKILYTRYTLTSAKTSIIPEYEEKIELFNAQANFKITEDEIINTLTGSNIIFKGIKNSSGNQTANLKSIKDPTKWILDEAEELPDYNTFQKIKRSLRKKGSKIQSILILNPGSKSQWMYEHFFEANNIPDYFNGSVNGITFIYTNYLDNIDNLDESFLNDAEKTRLSNYEEYEQVFLGKWGKIRTGYEYYCNFKHIIHIKQCIYNPLHTLHFGFDQNVNPYYSGLSTQISKENDKYYLRVLKEFTPRHPHNKAEVIARKMIESYSDECGMIYLYGDASGNKEDTRGFLTDYDIIKKVLLKHISNNSDRTLRKNPLHKKRRPFINDILAGKMNIVVEIDPSCKLLIEDLESVKEDADGGVLKETFKDKLTGITCEKYGHLSDVFCYILIKAFKSYFDNYSSMIK